jgi:hypothetical protein
MAGLTTRATKARMLTLPDCIGLQGDEKCKWLNVPSCVGEGCAFYQKIDSAELALRRIRTLDAETQDRISQKYYGGSKPWMEAANRAETAEA